MHVDDRFGLADLVQLFGAQKRAALGLSTGSYSHQRRGTGFIYQCDLVQSIPEEYRLKAQRTVSAKCVLAVRMDINKSNMDGGYGEQLYGELEKKLEKLTEPPPTKVTKALPVPTEGPKKRRGGQRCVCRTCRRLLMWHSARKAKEQYATSELQKLRNRMRFGEQEEEDMGIDESIGLGMIGTSSGRIRANAGETRTKGACGAFLHALTSRSEDEQVEQEPTRRAQGGIGIGLVQHRRRPQLLARLHSCVCALACRLTIAAVQGLELADPAQQKRKLEAANEGWLFKESGTFSVRPK